MQIVKKILFLLNSRERKQAVLLLFMIIIMAFLEMIGVVSILPFMAVLTNPDLIETNHILNSMFKFSNILGVENNQHFLFVLGVLVFVLLITSLTFKALTTYAQVWFVQMRQYSVSKRLLEGYLNQPYSWFLNRHSADLGKNILSEVAQVVGGGMSSLIDIIAKSMVTIALIILLIVIDPKLALIVGLSLGGAYLLIFYFVRKYLDRLGIKRLFSNELRFKSVVEAFGATKEIKVGGLEQTYIKKFSYSSLTLARTVTSSTVVSQLPRFIFEAVAFGGILLIILYFMAQTNSFNKALPIVSLYVFAGYRLLPALQQIYGSITAVTFVVPSLNKLHQDLENIKPLNVNQNRELLTFANKIELKNIDYNYPNSSRTALKNISLKIPFNSTIGLVGATGSGKTTTVDVILGLLESHKGTLEVDGNIITKQNVRSWQRTIGYVPQHIFLSDDSVAANIAFGVEPKDINLAAVEKAAKIANLHKFIVEELPQKYQTAIGERGVRLSGGQRQRIGVARALYHDPKVLILDEATSALDSNTEKAVMDAVNNLRKNITIILIAHRLSTVKKCDMIYLLDKGQLKDWGTFEELIKVNEQFRDSAKNI